MVRPIHSPAAPLVDDVEHTGPYDDIRVERREIDLLDRARLEDLSRNVLRT